MPAGPMACGGIMFADPGPVIPVDEDTGATVELGTIVFAAISYVMWSVSDISDDGWLDSAEPCLIKS